MTVPVITFDEAKHRYLVNGRTVPSVTQILSVVDKSGPLTWWAMKIGVEGVAKLRALGEELPWDDVEGITKLLTINKLTVNHVRDQAGTRGTSLHTALEDWMQRQKVPNAADFPVEDRGYVQALARALLTVQFEVIDTEAMVASVEHGYAGRYDLFARQGSRLVRADLKTSKKIYPEQHFPQLEAYEHAAVECGGEPSDARMVIRLGADGEFEVAESWALFEDFLAIKRCYDAVTSMRSNAKRLAREAKAAA